MPVTEITTTQQFNDYLSNNPLILVDFYAQWCGPCKKIAPRLYDMSELYTQVTFLKVDVEVLTDLTERYEIKAMPTFMLFEKGNNKPLHTITGANEKKIDYAIKMALGMDSPQYDF